MTLFDPLAQRGVTLRNRIVVSPMCQYSSEDGFANDWHFAHLAAFATGGAGLVFTEATAVEARGRISPQDLGIYKDEHIAELRHITDYLHQRGAATGIQLAHAGRKASTYRGWSGSGAVPESDGGWPVIAPSAIAFHESYPMPSALSEAEIHDVVAQWAVAAKRALAAGFDVIEVHAAHGYLLHQFLSPLSNHRTDGYGGSLENRMRLTVEVTQAIRNAVPAETPVWVRISATDWTAGGWNSDESVELAKKLKAVGADLIDTSTGGNVSDAKIPLGPGYQVEFAERIRREAGISTGAVGMITNPVQADTIIRTGQADVVLMARELLRNPFWPAHAAKELGVPRDFAPVQYGRAW